MIKVQFVLVKSDDSELILMEKVFNNVDSKHNPEVSEYVYENVLKLDNKYDFINYEDCELIEIRYFKDNILLYTDDCVDYMYNL